MQRKVQLILRILLGALFTFGGVAFFFTTPPPLTGEMATFFTGLQASKYFFYLLKFTEIVTARGGTLSVLRCFPLLWAC